MRIIELRQNAFSFFLYFLYLFSHIQYILAAVYPSCTASCSPTTNLHSPKSTATVFLQKRAGFPGISAKHIISRYNKTSTSSYIKAVQDNAIGGKRYQEQVVESQTIRTTTNTLSKKKKNSMCTKDLAQRLEG